MNASAYCDSTGNSCLDELGWIFSFENEECCRGLIFTFLDLLVLLILGIIYYVTTEHIHVVSKINKNRDLEIVTTNNKNLIALVIL